MNFSYSILLLLAMNSIKIITERVVKRRFRNFSSDLFNRIPGERRSFMVHG